MSLLWKLVFNGRCTSTHHKLALDALRFLRGPMAEQWTNLFLANHEQYLTGAKAPDDVFKDFKNHVLHVGENFWGGATLTARSWYQKTVATLSQGNWPEAIYNAGVLSHYFTDPFQPFHTGQTEAEGKVHRPAEWSITKSYDELQAILEQDLGGYPQLELPERPDWLEEAIRAGATEAHASYNICIDHYDLARGIKNPPAGLDQEMKDRLAHLIGMASVGFSRVLERAFAEAEVTPPDVAVSLHALIATMKVPLNWVMKKITDARERAIVEAIYLEVQETGKAIESLPEDDKMIRKLHAQEVLRIPLRQLDAEPARPTGTQYGTGKPPRGMTAKTVGGSVYERTTISAPLRVETQNRDNASSLESCLMVPLAASKPIDHVADTALRALLSQPLKAQSLNPATPENQITASLLNRGALPAINQDSSPEKNDEAPVAKAKASEVRPASTGAAPVASPQSNREVASAKSKAATATPTQPASPPTAEKSTAKSSRQSPVQSMPQLASADDLLSATSALLGTASYAPEFDQTMFAPLPPMPRPRPKDRDSEKVSPTPPATLTATAPIKPETNQSTVTKPAVNKSAQTPTKSISPAGTASRTESIKSSDAAPVPRATAPQPRSNLELNRTRSITSQKSFNAEPGDSPIPVPHIKTTAMSAQETPLAEELETDAERDSNSRASSRIVVSGSKSAGLTTPHFTNRISSFATKSLTPDTHKVTTGHPPAAPREETAVSSAISSTQRNFAAHTSAPTTSVETLPSSLFADLSSSAVKERSANPITDRRQPPPAPHQADTSVPRSNIFQRAISPNPAARPAVPSSPVPSAPAAKDATAAEISTKPPAAPLQQRAASTPPNPPRVENPVPVQSPAPVIQPAAQTIVTSPLAAQTDLTQAPATIAAIPSAASPSTETQSTVEQVETEAQSPTATTQIAEQPATSTVTEPEVQSDTKVPNKEPAAAAPATREPKYYLHLQSPLKDAPSIGPKTAELFESVGVKTVFDFFRINTDQAAEKLGRTHITSAVLKDWQAQALLVCRIAGLRGHDAQFLVACGVRTAEQLASVDPQVLLPHVKTLVATPAGQRLLRGGKEPDLDGVTSWVTAGKTARSLRSE